MYAGVRVYIYGLYSFSGLNDDRSTHARNHKIYRNYEFRFEKLAAFFVKNKNYILLTLLYGSLLCDFRTKMLCLVIDSLITITSISAVCGCCYAVTKAVYIGFAIAIRNIIIIIIIFVTGKWRELFVCTS